MKLPKKYAMKWVGNIDFTKTIIRINNHIFYNFFYSTFLSLSLCGLRQKVAKNAYTVVNIFKIYMV